MPTYLCGAGILAIPRETSTENANPEIRIFIKLASSEEEFITRIKKKIKKIFPKESWVIKTLVQKFTSEEIKKIYKEMQEKLFFFAFLVMPINIKKSPTIHCCFVFEPSLKKAKKTAQDSFLYCLSSFESTVAMHIQEVPREIIEEILSPHLH